MYSRTIMILLLALTAVPAVAVTYKAHDPAWQGVWIQGPRRPGIPAADVDLRRYLERRPGGWSTSLVNRIVGHAAIAGIGRIYWRLDDGRGHLLFPAANADRVLRYPNWGVDFAAFDFPAAAAEPCRRLGLELVLVTNFPREAAGRYPGQRIIAPAEIREPVVAAVDLDPEKDAAKGLDHRTRIFRKTFRVDGPVTQAELCVTANGRYSVRLDGAPIGTDSDWSRGETYDLTSRFTPGEHKLEITVVPEKIFTGLLANLRWKDAAGKTVVLNTDLSWESRGEGEHAWTAVTANGFEGAGPRFRLKEPWLNRRAIAVGEDEHVPYPPRRVALRTDRSPEEVQYVMDGSHASALRWRATPLPATLELTLPEAVFLTEVRIYSGVPAFYGNPSGACGIKSCRLEYDDHGTWRLLAPPVTAAPDCRGPNDDQYVLVSAFTPRKVTRLRLVITGSHDTGRRLNAPDQPALPSAERVCFVREIELIKSLENDR